MNDADERQLDLALKNAEKSLEAVKELLVAEAARDIVATATEIAPDETDFSEAIHVENDKGDHALIVVEERINDLIRMYPGAVSAMRSSIEWDTEVRRNDVSRAAYAVVNEAYPRAEALWEQRLADKSVPGAR